MAVRPVYISKIICPYFKKESITFKYNPGFSIIQKKKNVEELHSEFYKKFKLNSILEVSSKSNDDIGIKLSAFNLKNRDGISVECLFQSSKVFLNGGPYTDLLYKSSVDAKKDERIKNGDQLIKFRLLDKDYPILPVTAFYDWIYIHTLFHHNKGLIPNILKYDAFSDIEFNPKKSFNCQAEAVAIFVGIYRCGIINNIVSDFDLFVKKVFTKISPNFVQEKLF